MDTAGVPFACPSGTDGVTPLHLGMDHACPAACVEVLLELCPKAAEMKTSKGLTPFEVGMAASASGPSRPPVNSLLAVLGGHLRVNKGGGRTHRMLITELYKRVAKEYAACGYDIKVPLVATLASTGASFAVRDWLPRLAEGDLAVALVEQNPTAGYAEEWPPLRAPACTSPPDYQLQVMQCKPMSVLYVQLVSGFCFGRSVV
jgi:hypothetical protein